MGDLTMILRPGDVRARLPVSSKKALFTQLAQLSATAVDGDMTKVLACLNKRERNGQTGYGAGTAIPHCKHLGLDQVRGFFVRLAEPIEYGAVDGVPVDLIFLLLSPTDTGPEHLKALAAVSRLLRDRETAAKLRGARSADALYALLTGDETHDAV